MVNGGALSTSSLCYGGFVLINFLGEGGVFQHPLLSLSVGRCFVSHLHLLWLRASFAFAARGVGGFAPLFSCDFALALSNQSKGARNSDLSSD